jgi:MFS family permease
VSSEFPVDEAAEVAQPVRRRVMVDLRPLQTAPAYRRLWIGSTVSFLGAQMTAVAVAIQVYSLTGSSFAVGAIGICMLVPMIMFGLYGGAVADAVDRRRLALASSTGLAAVSIVLAVQAFAGSQALWLLYCRARSPRSTTRPGWR